MPLALKNKIIKIIAHPIGASAAAAAAEVPILIVA